MMAGELSGILSPLLGMQPANQFTLGVPGLQQQQVSPLLGAPAPTQFSLQDTLGGQKQNEFNRNLDAFHELQSRTLNPEKSKEIRPPTKMTITQPDPNKPGDKGKAVLESDPENLQNVMQQLQQSHEIVKGFQNRSARLESQMQRQSPILEVIAQLAGNLAQDPNMPGWVQAAGRANLALNPTRAQLEDKQMGLQQTIAQLSSQGAMQEFQVRSAIQAQAASRAEAARKANEATIDNIAKLDDQFSKMVKDGALPAHAQLVAGYRTGGATPEQAEQKATEKEAEATAYRASQEKAKADEVKQKAAEALAVQKALAPGMLSVKGQDEARKRATFQYEENIRQGMRQEEAANDFARKLALLSGKQGEVLAKSQALQPKQRTELEAVGEVDSAIASILGDKALGLVGPGLGRFLNANPWSPEEWSRIKVRLYDLRKTFLKMSESGKISDKDDIAALKVFGSETSTPDQVRGALTALSEKGFNKRLNYAKAYAANWESGRDGALLGSPESRAAILKELADAGLSTKLTARVIEDPVAPKGSAAPRQQLKVGQKVQGKYGTIERVE